MVEERVGHHNDALFDSHPAAEGQVEGDSSVGHIKAVLVDRGTSILRLIIVGLLVLVRDKVRACRDVGHQEVTTFDWDRSPRHGHLFESLVDEITVRAEQITSAFNESDSLIVVVGLSSLI